MFAFVLTLTILATIRIVASILSVIIVLLCLAFDVDPDTLDEARGSDVVKFVIRFVMAVGIAIWGWIVILF